MSERFTAAWERGLRVAKRMAIAFGLSTAMAIGVGAAATDSAFAQIIVTVLAAMGFWLPMLFVTMRVERWFEQRQSRRTAAPDGRPLPASAKADSWKRLVMAAPKERDRLLAIRQSLESSRRSLGAANLDPDAHDLCVLIDRRLPELIDRELDSLPPDDRGRKRHIVELVQLVEQFARHCGRRRDGDPIASGYQAEVLRRRFEDRLSGAGSFDQ